MKKYVINKKIMIVQNFNTVKSNNNNLKKNMCFSICLEHDLFPTYK